jgi:hypothetical protein
MNFRLAAAVFDSHLISDRFQTIAALEGRGEIDVVLAGDRDLAG